MKKLILLVVLSVCFAGMQGCATIPADSILPMGYIPTKSECLRLEGYGVDPDDQNQQWLNFEKSISSELISERPEKRFTIGKSYVVKSSECRGWGECRTKYIASPKVCSK